MIVGIPPANPRGRPNFIRRPAPAQPFVPKPTPIMKRRPAPGIIGAPIPAAISVNPATTVAIRTPSWVGHYDGGLPALAIARDVNPVTVGSKCFVKLGIVALAERSE